MKDHRTPLYWKIAAYIAIPMLLLLSVIPAGILTEEPESVYADTKDNSSVYYISNAQASQENTVSATPNSRNIKKYAVKIQNGKISVFENDNPTPLYTIETPPSRLPAADRLLLETGIQAETFEEACGLIEDYE